MKLVVLLVRISHFVALVIIAASLLSGAYDPNDDDPLYPNVPPSRQMGCGQQAYFDACIFCSFTEGGKINDSCKNGYTSNGRTCIMSKYPVAAGMYTAGNCTEWDDCVSQTSACVRAASTGNDKEDCTNMAIESCYTQGDACIETASRACAARAPRLPCGITLFVLAGAGLVLLAAKSR